mgnify:CR=1 FL=1
MKRIVLSFIMTISLLPLIGQKAFSLRNGQMEMTVIDYGARIQSLRVGGQDVVLGFDTDSLSKYTTVKQNFGAVVGRYIGRILAGKLTIDGQKYQLQTGSNGDCSHGGTPSFSQQYWTLINLSDETITLRYVSPDGENGFPGELTLDVTYTLTSDALRIDYSATTTKPTVLNPSNHTFFNLTGRFFVNFAGGDITKAYDGVFADAAKVNKQLKALFIGTGTAENLGSKGVNDKLQAAGVKTTYYESEGTAHEWLTWRRCLKEFIPHLFK